jgi:hypothetical protein
MNKRNRTSVFPIQATHTHIGKHVERLLEERPQLGLRLLPILHFVPCKKLKINLPDRACLELKVESSSLWLTPSHQEA